MMDTPMREVPDERSTVTRDPRLYFLDHGGNRVLSSMSDGSGLTVLVSDGCAGPDGIAIDVAEGHLYWTNMGVPSHNDGFIMRCDLDGRHVTTIVPPGTTRTPKQLVVEPRGGHLYWCDREGMRVMRCKLDGSSIEILAQTGHGARDRADARNWCVGIAIDIDRQQMYWTQKGASKSGTGRILRAPLNTRRKSGSPASRGDIETLFSALPEPVDLELDPATMTLYWTDRGAPPFGNTLNRSHLDDPDAGELRREVLHGGFKEAIGLFVHPARNVAFISDLGGSIYQVALDGSSHASIALRNAGDLTGIIAV
jgi:hypothetical protein